MSGGGGPPSEGPPGAGASRPVAIVTGAGSGVGAEAALALAHGGFSLVLAGRRIEALRETEARIRAPGGSALAVACDVTEERSVTALFDTAIRECGRVDVVFNNAGVGMPDRDLEDVTLDEWDRVVATNVTGVFLCTREAFRAMKRQQPRGGRIINNGSISAHVPRPGSIAYTASKHAVTGLTRATALDGRGFGIACGQIDIGNATTPMTEAMRGPGTLQADGSRRREPTIPATEVARAVVYMATLPLEANVLFMTVMATGMPYVGRG
ncbi:MAG TPA: SDR family oxidoreductase [Solirubrobacteraceae bacterium]|nr:SDR family oxidoreductase [Solirubrobacteraceae bacterium]